MRDFGHHEDGEDEVVGGDARAGTGFGQRDLEGMALVKHPEHRTHQQEDEEEGKDHHGTQGQRFAAFGHVLAGQHSLHDQLLGPVRGEHQHRAADDAHPDVKGRAEQELRHGDAGRRGGVQPVEFARGDGFGKHRAHSAIHDRGDVPEGEDTSEQEQTELDGVRPDHRLDAADVGVEQREQHEEQDGAEDGVAGAEAEQFVSEDEFDRDAGDIDAHAGGQSFADEEEPAGGLARGGAEGVGEQLVRGIDFAFEIVGHEDDGQKDAGNDVADDHLEEGDVAAVGHGGDTDDGQGAGLGGDDGQANPPPGDALAAEKVVAGIALVLPKPHPKADDAKDIEQNDDPITGTEVAVHVVKSLQLLGKPVINGQQILSGARLSLSPIRRVRPGAWRGHGWTELRATVPRE